MINQSIQYTMWEMVQIKRKKGWEDLTSNEYLYDKSSLIGEIGKSGGGTMRSVGVLLIVKSSNIEFIRE